MPDVAHERLPPSTNPRHHVEVRCLTGTEGRRDDRALEPFASVYDDRSRLGVSLALRRSGFEVYAADDPAWDCFRAPAQSRCRDHHDAPVGGPGHCADKVAQPEPT
jgi:hypothetical protein